MFKNKMLCAHLLAMFLIAAFAQPSHAQKLVFELDQVAAADRGLAVTPALLEKVALQAQARLDHLHDDKNIANRIDLETDAEQLKILVPFPASPNSDDVSKVKSALLNTTFIELALLANTIQHIELIELAQRPDNLNKTRVYKQDKLVGLWCPVSVDSKGKPKIAPSPKVATRTANAANENTLEFLVVIPPNPELRLTNSDFASVAKQNSDFGPMIGVEFNHRGGELMQKLTSNNLPMGDFIREPIPESTNETQAEIADEPSNNANFRSRLAIIIDGKIHMAPQINGVISRQCVIQGRFENKEVDDLIKSLKLPPLDVPLILSKEIGQAQ